MLVRSHSEESLRFVYALEFVFATVFERDASRRARQATHDVRDEYLAWLRDGLHASRDLHSTTMDVVAFADDIACVDAEVQWQLSLVT